MSADAGEGFLVIVPARTASTRLPEKPLRVLAGRPMILHVVDRARESGARAVYVATDDVRVETTCAAAGADVVMTAAHHASGSERLAEACDLLGLENTDIVVNVQGDEPLMPPPVIRQVAGLLTAHADADMASLYHRIEDPQDVFDPNVVKVVLDGRGRALYFSRAPIPWEREAFSQPSPCPRGAHLRHIGIYAYRAGFLRRYVRLAPADIEEREALEQLRAIYHGAVVQMAPACAEPGPGVDTPEDLERVRAMMVPGR